MNEYLAQALNIEHPAFVDIVNRAAGMRFYPENCIGVHFEVITQAKLEAGHWRVWEPTIIRVLTLRFAVATEYTQYYRADTWECISVGEARKLVDMKCVPESQRF
jgi:hypothetical protein